MFEREKGKDLGNLIDASEACGYFFELHGCLLSSPSVNVESTSLIGRR